MNMPGFTAEASLLNSDMRYQATTVAAVYGEFIQPAGMFDVYTPRQPPFLGMVIPASSFL